MLSLNESQRMAEKVKELEAENARLRAEVQELMADLAYHGVYPK